MKNKLKKNSFIEGTIIASLAIVITKILGTLYVIPFYSIIGENGGVLYSYAYNIYNLFLNISTAGLPLAISMLVSEYISLNMYEAKERTYKIAKYFTFGISFIAFLILIIFAPNIAGFMLKGIEGGNTISDVATVIRAISFCLLITPFLSVIRGYLQGNKFIAPTSISQVIEQIVRIAIILIGSYVSIKLLDSSITIGVSVALSGAFFGGLVAFLYLKFKINKNKKLFIKSEKKDNISNKEIINNLIKFSIPLIIISIVNNLYEITDMKLIIKALYMIGYSADKAELIASITCTWGPKICMIIGAIALGLVTSLMPHLVNSYTLNDMDEVNKKFNQALATIITICLPMGIGLFCVAEPTYFVFYNYSPYGPLILKFLAFLTVISNIVLVVNMSLQSLKRFKVIYLNTGVGLLVNLILDVPLVLLFNKIGIYPFYGTVAATIIGYLCSLTISFIYINKTFKFKYTRLFNTLKKLIISTLAMTIVLAILRYFFPIRIITRANSVLGIIIYIVIAVGVFALIGLKNGLLYDTFGKSYIDNVLIKLHLKRKDEENDKD